MGHILAKLWIWVTFACTLNVSCVALIYCSTVNKDSIRNSLISIRSDEPTRVANRINPIKVQQWILQLKPLLQQWIVLSACSKHTNGDFPKQSDNTASSIFLFPWYTEQTTPNIQNIKTTWGQYEVQRVVFPCCPYNGPLLISLSVAQSKVIPFPFKAPCEDTQYMCAWKERAFSPPPWHQDLALHVPRGPVERERSPQEECPQWGPRVNNLHESLLAQCSLWVVDALPLLLLCGGSICPPPLAVSTLAIFYLHPFLPPRQKHFSMLRSRRVEDTTQIPAPVTSLITLTRTNWVYWRTFLWDQRRGRGKGCVVSETVNMLCKVIVKLKRRSCSLSFS